MNAAEAKQEIENLKMEIEKLKASNKELTESNNRLCSRIESDKALLKESLTRCANMTIGDASENRNIPMKMRLHLVAAWGFLHGCDVVQSAIERDFHIERVPKMNYPGYELR